VSPWLDAFSVYTSTLNRATADGMMPTSPKSPLKGTFHATGTSAAKEGVKSLGEPFHKLLRDFPLNKWMEAADGCDVCGAKYKVKVTHVYTGDFGEVEWVITHKPDCPEDPGTESDWDNAGWQFMPKPFTFHGKLYYPLKSRANIGPCLSCGKLIIGVPLILFINKGQGGTLDFCFNCAKQLSITKMLKRR